MSDSRVPLRERENCWSLFTFWWEAKHSKAGVFNLFIKKPMCQLGNTSLQQREIFSSSTQTWLPSSACSISIWGPQNDLLFAQEPTPHLCSLHGFLPQCRSVCLKTELTGTVSDKANNLSFWNNWKYDLTAGETALFWKEQMNAEASLSYPALPKWPGLSFPAENFQYPRVHTWRWEYQGVSLGSTCLPGAPRRWFVICSCF